MSIGRLIWQWLTRQSSSGPRRTASRGDPPLEKLAPGERLGHYKIVRMIGSGGMGRVYQAVHTQIGRQVAIKVLHPQLSHDEEMVTRLLHEAHTANLVHHPGVVQITDHRRQNDGMTYLVMELLEGETLRARLRRGPAPSKAQILSIGGQLAAAIAAAHQQGVIHRDLKPENVMLIPDGQRVKILDFGIARSSSYGNQLTQDGRRMGTPAYMAPEQCAGERATAAADVYSLGALLYELCAGSPPFVSEDAGVLYALHRFEEPRPLSGTAPQTDEALARLIHDMLAKDPAARPTMAEVNEEFQDLGVPAEVLLGAATLYEAAQSVVLTGKSLSASQVGSLHHGAYLPGRGRRLLLGGLAATAVSGAVGWIALKDVTIAHQIHYRTVSSAISESLQARPSSVEPLGPAVDSEFYCAWFQNYPGGKVIYTSQSISGIPAGPHFRAFFVLSTEPTPQGNRWAMFSNMNYQPIRDRDLFLQAVAQGRAAKPALEMPHPFPPIADIGNYFQGPVGPVDALHPKVAGSIARLYALQSLDPILGKPLNTECATTVVIKTHKNGLVIGGAPNDSCAESHGIYLMFPEKEQPPLTKGHWERADRYPLWSDLSHRHCLPPSVVGK